MNEFSLTWAPRVLSLLRVMTGLFFLQHGTQKFLGIPTFPATGTPAFMTMGWFGGLLELAGGLLIILGLFTRPVAFILSGQMAVAYFMFHAPRGFFPILNAGELAALYCFVFLYFAAAGPGSFSLDSLIARRRL